MSKDAKKPQDGLMVETWPIERLIPYARNPRKNYVVAGDFFGGFGSTLIACERTGRKRRMMELEPHYCDVIIRRWQDFTGKKAVNATAGAPFGE